MSDGPQVTVTSVATDPNEPAKRGRMCVLVAHSEDETVSGSLIELPRVLEIGRRGGEDLGLAIDDREMSRQHTKLIHNSRSGAVEVHDAGSKNGTFVDGVRAKFADVKEGSVIRTGNTVMVLDRFLGNQCIGQARLDEAVSQCTGSDLPVLLLGETGTGKDVTAQRIHQLSGVKGAYVPVNCTTIPESLMEASFFGHRRGAFTGATEDAAGLFEHARRGTLFLDEVGDLDVALQPKLLRALETGEFRRVGEATLRRSIVRPIAATNCDLASAVREGTFRADLYARLAGFVIEVPPLRRRKPQIPSLVATFLKDEGAPGAAANAEFWEYLLCYSWPMNVRELRTWVRRALAVRKGDGPMARKHLPEKQRPPSQTSVVSETPTLSQMQDFLTLHKGNVSAVATAMGKDRKSVYRWLQRYDLDPTNFRS